jgi:hypothetical protein
VHDPGDLVSPVKEIAHHFLRKTVQFLIIPLIMTTNDRKFKRFSDELLGILEKNHRDSVDSSVCVDCSGLCCIQGGPGILENVLLIYEAYERGELSRSDYEFEEGLSLPAFVARYFDVCFMPSSSGPLVLFYAKTLTQEGALVSWHSIDDYGSKNPELIDRLGKSAGCVFLDSKITEWPDGEPGESRSCILHGSESNSCLTEKPVYCTFYSCVAPFEIRKPDVAVAADWVDALAKSYPDSTQRFNDIMAKNISS